MTAIKSTIRERVRMLVAPGDSFFCAFSTATRAAIKSAAWAAAKEFRMQVCMRQTLDFTQGTGVTIYREGDGFTPPPGAQRSPPLKRPRRGAPEKYPMSALEVGGSFLLPKSGSTAKHNAASAIYARATRMGIKVSMRTERDGYRFTRVE